MTKVSLFLRLSTGELLEFSAQPDWTVIQLGQELQTQLKETIDTNTKLRFSFHGKLMEENRTLSDFKFADESILDVGLLRSTRFACPKCYSEFSMDQNSQHSPCILSCGHGICKSCVPHPMSTNEKTPFTFACIVCQKDSFLKFDEFQFHEKLIGLIKYEQSEIDEQFNARETCFACGDLVSACYCQNCRHSFCEECDEMIHDSGSFKFHTREALEDRLIQIKCRQHNKPAVLWCVDDECLICAECLAVGQAHCGHSICSLSVKEDEFLKERAIIMEKIASRESRVTEYSKQTGLVMEDVIQSTESNVARIKLETEKLKQLLDQRRDAMIENEEKKRDLKLEELGKFRTQFASMLATMRVTQESFHYQFEKYQIANDAQNNDSKDANLGVFLHMQSRKLKKFDCKDCFEKADSFDEQKVNVFLEQQRVFEGNSAVAYRAKLIDCFDGSNSNSNSKCFNSFHVARADVERSPRNETDENEVISTKYPKYIPENLIIHRKTELAFKLADLNSNYDTNSNTLENGYFSLTLDDWKASDVIIGLCAVVSTTATDDVKPNDDPSLPVPVLSWNCHSGDVIYAESVGSLSVNKRHLRNWDEEKEKSKSGTFGILITTVPTIGKAFLSFYQNDAEVFVIEMPESWNELACFPFVAAGDSLISNIDIVQPEICPNSSASTVT